MRSFESIFAAVVHHRVNEHGGRGPIAFRRVLEGADFGAPIDFVDYTLIPPGSEIGWHQHVGSEEFYFVISGTPLMRVDGEEKRMAPGGIAVVHDGGYHALVNDTLSDVEILVVQVRT